ncbi:hypothetical protein Zm00014a_029307 [Zea mays]|uniref:Rhodopsin n=1 Tax=Zea mays TaxID=4577 RepID=A0A3L6EDY1_MAIZE|nr:hypothetical protein Zm00014a_029307 [Zea mays]
MGGGKDKHDESDKGLFSNLMHGVAGGHGYPPQGYPPQGYPPQPGAYPPPPGAYPPPPGAYPPQYGYPQPGGYPTQGGYPPAGYPGSSHQDLELYSRTLETNIYMYILLLLWEQPRRGPHGDGGNASWRCRRRRCRLRSTQAFSWP